MKSKIEISSRAAHQNACALSVLLLLAAACSGGRSALSTEPRGASTTSASTPAKSDLPACGSMTKPCDPNNLGGQTCESLGAGGGTLLCDPITCSFDRSMCTSMGTTGGGGLGALLGQFARNQGGRGGALAQGMGGRGGRGAMSNSGRGGSSEGQREDAQEAEEGGRGGERSADDQSDQGDQDDQDDDQEASRDGEGGSTAESPDAGSSNPGEG
jgi:hypothetical protein